MIDMKTMLFIAQASSVITSIIGIVLLIYITKVIKHLVKDNFRKIFSLLGIFFLVALVGVISMTSYHFFEDSIYEDINENVELLWYLFLFISVPISVYGSQVIIKLEKSLIEIEKEIRKIGRGRNL